MSSQNTENWILDDLQQRKLEGKGNKSLLYILWSKLASIMSLAKYPSQPQTAIDDKSEIRQQETVHERHYYPHFTDRVDPSLYYSVFSARDM
jgi:hypothetical protein